jgi:hypothetical protein
MHFLSTTRQRVGAAAAAVAVAGGAGAFVLVSGAFASASTPQPAAVTSATAHHPKLKKHGILAHADYATLQVKRHGQWVTYVLDRGKVTAVTSSQITIARPDGVTVSVALSSSTKYKGVSGESAVKVGQHASVISVNGSAVRVSQMQHQAKSSSTTAALTGATGR